MNARDAILANIRKKRASTLKEPLTSFVQKSIRPAYTHVFGPALQQLFLEKLTAAAASYTLIDSINQAPLAIDAYLKEKNYDFPLRLCPALKTKALPWQRQVSYGPARDEDRISVVLVPYGVAETGTLVSPSSPETPTTLNFMAEVSIVIVHSKNIVANYEDAWQGIVQKQGLPRTVNFITGPSRTADIAQTLLLGIHGPRFLHVLVVNSQ